MRFAHYDSSELNGSRIGTGIARAACGLAQCERP